MAGRAAGGEIPALMPSQHTQPQIPYELQRRRRRTVGITVRDDGTVEVRAPQRASQRQIDEVVEQHRAWIVEKTAENRRRWRRLQARRFDDGDDIPYLGGVVRLVVRESLPQVHEAPRRDGDDLIVTIPGDLGRPARRAVTRYAVGRWLLDEARTVFHRRHIVASRRVGDAADVVVIKDMRSRWGSCGPTRRMSLNWRLVMAPRDVIDYVIAHELVHIRVPDHSERFWTRLAGALPDYASSRDWLRDHGADLAL